MDEIPSGLEDLLNSIREDSVKSSSAIVLAKKEKNDDLVEEDVDEIILNLLGLEDVNDIDYATYKTLLKEKMLASRMTNSQIPTEESEILDQEYRKVKRKTGRFEINKKKVKVDTFFQRRKTGANIVRRESKVGKNVDKQDDTEKLKEESEKSDSIQEKNQDFIRSVLGPSIKTISENLDSIIKTLNKQIKLENKQSDKERKIEEKAKQREKESKIERKDEGSGIIGRVVDKVKQPFSDLFGWLTNFLTQTLLGGLVIGLFNFLKDPGAILRPLYEFINGIIEFINKMIKFIVEIPYNIINTITGAINESISFLINSVNSALELINKVPLVDIPMIPVPTPIPPLQAPTIEIPTIPIEEPKVQGMQGGGLVMNLKSGDQVYKFEKGGKVDMNMGGLKVMPPTNNISVGDISYEGGGSISGNSGVKISGMGPDTQLIAAQPGEIVMSRSAVQAYGADTLLQMNKSAGGTNKPKSGKIKGFQGGGMVPVKGGAAYDVIIPLDHVRPENTRKVPDRKGGNTFRNAAATGADGRERQHQDPAAQQMAARLRSHGLRVKILTPEEMGNYEDYDRFIQKHSRLGTRILPLHFDAGYDRNGRMVGTGFLTRTRSGDRDDSQLASPIQRVLSDFQKNNPDLGRISQDTVPNATVNKGAASPTALIELGVMTFWEKKYGKNFTQTPEFQNFIKDISDAAVRGGQFSNTMSPSQTQLQKRDISQSSSETPPPAPSLPPPEVSEPNPSLNFMKNFSRVGETLSDSGVINNFFSPQGKSESKFTIDMSNLVDTGIRNGQPLMSRVNEQRTISPPRQGGINPIYVPTGGGKAPTHSSASSGPSQKDIPPISPSDSNNSELIVIKSIYNIVG